MGKKTKVAVVGAGYWGKNLVRNFGALGVLDAICDSRKDTLDGTCRFSDISREPA